MLLLIFYVDVILLLFFVCFFCSQATTSNSMSRRIYLPDPDQTVMEEWAKEVGREESEVKEDENNV